MDYDKLLNEWFDKVANESDKRQNTADKIKDYNYNKGYSSGFSDGLLFATSILSRLEKREKRKIK